MTAPAGGSLRPRFDLNDDVPWERLDEPGVLCGPAVLDALGFDVRDLPAVVAADLDLVVGLVMARLIVALDADERRAAVFSRLERFLSARAPQVAAAVNAAWRPAPPLDPVAAVLFDEHAVWLHETLAATRVGGRGIVQPVWLAAHGHRAAAKTRALAARPAPPERRRVPRALGDARLLRVEHLLYDLLCLDVCALALALLHRGLHISRAPVRDLPLFDDILQRPAFRGTRAHLELGARASRRDEGAAPEEEQRRAARPSRRDKTMEGPPVASMPSSP